MHQPDYRPAGGAQAVLPWVRLHAVSGYLDMAAMLQRHPAMRCVVNFSGILLEQLLEYSPSSHDAWAQLSLRRPGDLTAAEAEQALRDFFSTNLETRIRPLPRYLELYGKREGLREGNKSRPVAAHFSSQELTDLAVLFNLAWIGFTGRKRADVQALLAKGSGFTLHDQQQVIAIHDELVAEVLPRYRELGEAGSVELSFTPYHHPILPLLLDLSGEGHPDPSDPLPGFGWPQDATEHVRRGMRLFERAFGRRPSGCWPAEGAVSDAALATLEDAGLRWDATDQQNLRQESLLGHVSPWRWQRGGRGLLTLFRDTRLSDNIGFEYASWSGPEAAAHFVKHVVRLGAESGYDRPVVTVALDGENPWEAYLDGGEAFLDALYGLTSKGSDVSAVTPSELPAVEWPVLGTVHSGSWIGGSFDIWTRDAETRQAWRLLARARAELDYELGNELVYAHLLAAEGSDWFWWYGGTFESDQKPQFDALFRGRLIAAYQAAGRDVPAEFRQPILSRDAVEGAGGAQSRG